MDELRIGRKPPVGNSSIHKMVGKLEGGPYYTVAQLAWYINVTEKTVKQWIRTGKIKGATKQISWHGQLIYLYTIDDMERFLKFAERQSD
jgi:hypothetical protein